MIAKRYDYTAYGGPKIMSGTGTVLADSTKDNRYGYTGRERDETLGQCYFRARMYDAGAGRFLSRDRLKYMVAMGLFVFHDGRALSFLDPTVECSKRNIEHPEWHHQYPERLTFTSLSRSSKTHRPSRINTKSLVRRVVVTMIVGEAIKDFK